MRNALAAWRVQMNAQTNAPNPQCDPQLYEQLYIKTDVSQYDSSLSNSDQQTQVLQWRKGMDSALRR
jgi:hypothetical protein